MHRYWWIALLLAPSLLRAETLPSPTTAEPAAMATTITARGQLVARRKATLSAGMTGRVERLSVRSGERIGRGALLIRFDCRAARANRAVARSRLDAATSQYRVNQRLAELQNISTLDLELSRAEEAIATAELKRIDAELEQCSLTAPFSGEVVERFIEPEHYVKQGDPLLRLVDPTDLEIEMVLPSTLLQQLRVGDPLEMRVDELQLTLRARVERVIGEVDPVSQTVRVVATTIEGEGRERLLPGMSGRVTVSAGGE